MTIRLRGPLAALLLDGPSYGYRLKVTLEAELGPLWAARPSQLYLALARMTRDGLVVSRRVRQATRPDRQLLELTKPGRQVAERWLFDQGPSEEVVLRLAIGRLVVPERFDELVTTVVAERSASLRQLRSLRAEAEDGFQPEALAAEMARVQAELRWADGLRDRSRELVRRPRAGRQRGERVVRPA
jgi:DNA-binding PadR family transcriptional regulator